MQRRKRDEEEEGAEKGDEGWGGRRVQQRSNGELENSDVGERERQKVNISTSTSKLKASQVKGARAKLPVRNEESRAKRDQSLSFVESDQVMSAEA